MRPIRLSLILALFSSSAALADTEPGFKPLFNGKDLTGWKSTGKGEVWAVEDGLLFCKGSGGGYLMTEKEYANFELRFEYRMPKMGNSGVAVRAPLTGNPSTAAMEIQLLDDENWKGLKEWQHCGSIYGVVPAKTGHTKPAGEWNAMKIIANGRKITIELNGTVIVDANLDDYKEHIKGDKEKKIEARPGLAREKGHLGFQSYNFRVDFKNVRIKELP
jgi:hypothetical protein